MTAVEIATGIIDKLQEENRACLETLHKAQDTIKYNERQLLEKDRLIKVLEERLQTGTDGILEMTNRQKELTIKHLEMQIQKVLKENEEMEHQLDAIKSEICAKCETKLLLRNNKENKSISKGFKPLSSTKTSSVLFEKKTSQSLCPNRVKSLERIIEHKDKRIVHLSKEVQRLTKTEKDLTQKIYRLTKLLPMSRLPSETVTDCLLQEIQLLESEKQSSDNLLDEDLLNLRSKSTVGNFPTMSNFKTSSSNMFNKAKSVIKPGATSSRYVSTGEGELTKAENEILHKKLQKLCSDVNELRRLFVFESEKLSQCLNSTTKEYRVFKTQLEEIISNLNDVIHSILNNNLFQVHGENVSSKLPLDSDDKYVISCLQERLKEALGLISEYEKENKILLDNLTQLKRQLAEQEMVINVQNLDEKPRSLPELNKPRQDMNEMKKLKEIIKIKESQLQAADSHINTCQKFIAELQKSFKNVTEENLKGPSSSSEGKVSVTCEQENKALKTRLDVSEKNIKTCENIIEQLQGTIRQLEEENIRLETEIHMKKSQKVLESSDSNKESGEVQYFELKNLNDELQIKIQKLEYGNSKLNEDIKLYENKQLILETVEQEKSAIKAQLEASEKHICSLEKNIETLKEQLQTAEGENAKLVTEMKNINHKNYLAETYENDVMSLTNDLILKEKEIRELKDSLHDLENKALEMNHYRKSLHQEIEKLCKLLMEADDSNDDSKRKAIYKAAVLHSAQALLGLDDNFNMKPDESDGNSALEEMKHQIEVYLTEVSRIHELVTLKEQERDTLVKEYLDLNDNDVLPPSLYSRTESNLHRTTHTNLPSMSTFCNTSPSSESGSLSTSKKMRSVKFTENKFSSGEARVLQEELIATKSVTNYLLSSCTRLEDLLGKEKNERSRCEIELVMSQETIKDLKAQLNMRNNMTKRLNTIIEMMRSKECNDEITLEQLKSEIKWLIEENQKIFDRVTTTQSELCHCKEENTRIQNDLDTLKRQLLNEKYECAKVNNELKHLKIQLSHSQSTLNDS